MDQKRGVRRSPQTGIPLHNPPPDGFSELEVVVGVNGNHSAC